MTISGHNMVMKKANVSELKAKLSAYLAEVRGGATVVVYDRATPIARLEPFSQDDDLVVIEATAPPADLKRIKGVRPKKAIDVDKLLGELRKDR
jgi:antitoxin (DNA-binding transcriptional repressor) of toxin-antitoxin stability system